MVITREKVEKLKERIKNPEEVNECRDELKKMLEIKGALLWKAEACSVCVGWQLPAQLSWEVQTLENTLEALQGGDTAKAVSLLEGYIPRLE